MKRFREFLKCPFWNVHLEKDFWKIPFWNVPFEMSILKCPLRKGLLKKTFEMSLLKCPLWKGLLKYSFWIDTFEMSLLKWDFWKIPFWERLLKNPLLVCPRALFENDLSKTTFRKRLFVNEILKFYRFFIICYLFDNFWYTHVACALSFPMTLKLTKLDTPGKSYSQNTVSIRI